MSLIRILSALILCVAVAGCGMTGKTPQTVPNVARERTVDPARALALINRHRTANGLAPLINDPRLSAIAAETARELARRNTLRTRMHTPGGIKKRFNDANYAAVRGAENLGAGYPTLVLAVEGWKTSREHNKNLLNGELTHAGIGLALTDEGQFKSFWVLLLARPDGAT
ncbi:CAP domain-containing protein [Acuticoccus sp. MNP-M23]|uniref:CAP domain-containing protein n=1 Tax=Acuticoccus sp. MNP-M23 TaxID=3072793 RepID=UPI00281687C1|nr:CAP domain-containing protein [Acuticoccus sp. MNP-M23]WMS42843.1 CAP domain-containing protein [Acuticoccus sp. MNP-M23]